MAIITPLPKYLETKKTFFGIQRHSHLEATRGKNEPKAESANNTKTDAILAPIYWPLYPLLHEDMIEEKEKKKQKSGSSDE